MNITPKPLVWTHEQFGRWDYGLWVVGEGWRVLTPVGELRVYLSSTSGRWVWNCDFDDGRETRSGDCDSADEGKNQAETFYRERITPYVDMFELRIKPLVWEEGKYGYRFLTQTILGGLYVLGSDSEGWWWQHSFDMEEERFFCGSAEECKLNAEAYYLKVLKEALGEIE